jgi:hypothetical protein
MMIKSEISFKIGDILNQMYQINNQFLKKLDHSIEIFIFIWFLHYSKNSYLTEIFSLFQNDLVVLN